jgi:hypothetical protein
MPQEVDRCATDFMKVYFKNEKKPICIEIFIHSLKYINLFCTGSAPENFYVLQCATDQKSLRTTVLEDMVGEVISMVITCSLLLANGVRE